MDFQTKYTMSVLLMVILLISVGFYCLYAKEHVCQELLVAGAEPVAPIRRSNLRRVIPGLRCEDTVAVRFEGIHLAAHHIALVARLPRVEWILIDQCSYTESPFSELDQCLHLKRLSLWGQVNASEILQSMPTLSGITKLELCDSDVSDSDLLQFASRFPNVEWLDLWGTNVTDGCHISIKRLRHLSVLILSHTSVSGRGVIRCCAGNKLQTVAILGIEMTDVECRQLAMCPKLDEIYFSDGMMSEAATDELERVGIHVRPINEQ